MGRWLVPAAMIAALIAFAVAAMTVGSIPEHPTWWRAAVALVVLAGITPVIYAVNIRVVPVFSRRSWPSLQWLRVQVALAIAGGWAVYLARIGDAHWLELAGASASLLAAVIFTVNIIRLFRRPVTGPPSPLPFPEQATVDKIATQFTRLSGLYLLAGLVIGVLIAAGMVEQARWDLVWAHAMLIGFFLSMASGVCYHVLSRWTGKRWLAIWPMRVHLLAVTVGLPLMLVALATNVGSLFAVAGPLQAAALALFLIIIAPQVLALPGWSRPAIAGAALCLVIGIGLGTAFAIDRPLGARLRIVHAELNLFGWAGLLITGVGYYLVPRFAGRPLRWPRLAGVQLALLGGGVALGAVAAAQRGYGHDPVISLRLAQMAVAGGFALFAIIVAGTFGGRPGVAVALSPPKRQMTIRARAANQSSRT